MYASVRVIGSVRVIWSGSYREIAIYPGGGDLRDGMDSSSIFAILGSWSGKRSEIVTWSESGRVIVLGIGEFPGLVRCVSLTLVF